jgi:Fur family zinc uptake transcriptional regulator
MTSDSLTHNHAHCIQTAMDNTVSLCLTKKLRLTPVRKRVLELIWKNHQPVRAYDLLALLVEEGFNSAPPTIYRALDFLLDIQAIHRLNSLNAYVGCRNPTLHLQQTTQEICLFICTQCQHVEEQSNDIWQNAIDTSAEEQKFIPAKAIIEISGLCQRCQ